ncbi:MAG: hypothetical protein LBD30_03945 [Verrucomicrobiales bacterium]|jgi:hypothetical protein|nr:hypothetical protein [Verrucomicrobiales bacterium]
MNKPTQRLLFSVVLGMAFTFAFEYYTEAKDTLLICDECPSSMSARINYLGKHQFVLVVKNIDAKAVNIVSNLASMQKYLYCDFPKYGAFELKNGSDELLFYDGAFGKDGKPYEMGMMIESLGSKCSWCVPSISSSTMQSAQEVYCPTKLEPNESLAIKFYAGNVLGLVLLRKEIRGGRHPVKFRVCIFVEILKDKDLARNWAQRSWDNKDTTYVVSDWCEIDAADIERLNIERLE